MSIQVLTPADAPEITNPPIGTLLLGKSKWCELVDGNEDYKTAHQVTLGPVTPHQ